MESTKSILSGCCAVELMQALSRWSNTTTLILQGGCVFEFKGVFPPGATAEGYYNLTSEGRGFEGHIKLDAVDRIVLQSKQHRGRESHAFVFQDQNGQTIFKVFLGRDSNGDLLAEQLAIFKQMKSYLLSEQTINFKKL